jgi:hypothetical protein
MSILAKMKAHPVLSIAGLGVAALGVDYFVEGDKSIAASFYRSIFGSGGGEHGKRGLAPHKVVPRGMPEAPAQVAPVLEYLPGYYPAFPAHYHPHWGHHARGFHGEMIRRGHYGRDWGHEGGRGHG